jgi:hypothetical protein
MVFGNGNEISVKLRQFKYSLQKKQDSGGVGAKNRSRTVTTGAGSGNRIKP